MSQKHERFQALRNLRRAVMPSSLLVVLFGAAFSSLAWEAERARQSAYLTSLSIAEDIEMDSYPGPLSQVLINLVQNAAMHAFEGRPYGSVSIMRADSPRCGNCFPRRRLLH